MKNFALDCPICAQSNLEFQFSKDGFDLYLCRACTVEFIHPLPSEEELNHVYSDPSYHQEVRYKTNVYRKLWENRLQQIESYGQQKGFLLDVGCATGIFLKAAEERSWAVKGIEKSTNAAKIARDLLGEEKIEIGDLLHFEEHHQFSVITAWALIEHVLQPLAYLQKMNDLLKPEGVVALSTPNTRSVSRILRKKSWRYYIPPHHLFYFNPQSIKKVLQLAGFEKVFIQTNFNIHPFFSEKSFLRLRYEKHKILRVFLKILLSPVRIMSNIFHLGDTMEIYAKKCRENHNADSYRL